MRSNMREKAARLIRELLTLLERADGQELMQVKCLKEKRPWLSLPPHHYSRADSGSRASCGFFQYLCHTTTAPPDFSDG